MKAFRNYIGLLLLSLFSVSAAYAQSIVHKKIHWTVAADTIKGASVHSTVLAGQSFIGTAQGTTYILHAGFFPVRFNNIPTNITTSTLTTPENNTMGSKVLTLATVDVGELNDFYTYSLVAGFGDNALFTLSNDTLFTTTSFDYETKSSYNIRLQTDDGDYGKFEKAFTIAITDNNDAPVSIMMDLNSIGENATLATLIGTFTSQDQDATNTHAYQLVAGDGDTDNSLFSITNNQLFTNSAYNFEAANTHTIRIKTTDNAGGTYEESLVIQIVDENDFPTDINYDATDLLLRAENEPMGTVVLNLSSVDQDVADAHSYTLVQGNGDSDNAYFAILGNQVILADTLNFELQTFNNYRETNTYNFRLQTSDGNGGTFEEAFSIETFDANDAPFDIVFPTTTIRDDKKVGDALGQFTVLDEDLNGFGEGDFHTFSLPSGKVDNGTFNIDAASGFLFSSKDYSANEIGLEYTVRVLARDSLGLVYSKDFLLTVVSSENSTNVAPLFIEAVTTQIEDHNIAQTKFVQLITADDAGDTHTYELIAGKGDTHNDYFSGFDNDWLVVNISFNVTSDSLFSVRVKATDNGGLSVEDTVTFTVIPFVDKKLPSISNVQVPSLFDYNTTVTISAEATDNTELESVNIFYKGISENENKYLSQAATSNNGSVYSFDMLPATHGDMGLEVYLSATDTSGNTFTTPTQKAYIQFNAGTYSIPTQYLGSGGEKTDWKIFSIPYDLEQKDFKNLFGEAYSTYDRINWRLVRWSDDGTGNGEYIDFEDNGAKADLGQGYWFNALISKDIALGAGKINMQDSTELTLTAGFNQIGNPYNVPISWTKVLENNGSPPEVGILQIFSESGGQVDGNVIQPFSGGFVYVKGTTTRIYVHPVTSKADVGGRTNNNLPASDLSRDSWLVEMNVSSSAVQQVIGSFGMHPDASIEKDQFDRLAVPRFQSYSEIYSKHENYSYPWFRRDIVNSSNQYTWDFTFESNVIEGLASFQWNPSDFGDGFETLNLYNKENGELIDMRAQSSYQFNGEEALKFAIFYSRDPKSVFTPAQLLLGNAYPNPTNGNTVFPVVLPNYRDEYSLEINIYNLQGKLTETIVKGKYKPGVHEFYYNFNEGKTTKGFFIYQLKFNDGFHIPVQKKIFIKN